MTLVELLVVIVIIVTVLGGVLPMISPNNEARKIREAARQLNTMFSQAQAQAARDGRPVGVAFREFGQSAPYSGMALEAFFIAEPAPFAGFSLNSRAVPTWAAGGPTYVDIPSPLYRRKYREYLGMPLVQINFYIAPGMTPADADAFPPSFLRIGDIIEMSGNLFIIADDEQPGSAPNRTMDDTALSPLRSADMLAAVWINYRGQQLRPGLQSYKIRRQPQNSSAAPLQFPAGVGIDMDASGAFGSNVPSSFDRGGNPDTIGIMFGPDGTLRDVYLNNAVSAERGIASQVYLLIGRFENGNNGNQNRDDFDFAQFPAQSDDELAQRRSRINWLNGDSRWIGISRSGRVVSAENKLFDPHLPQFVGPSNDNSTADQRFEQIKEARQYAEQSSNEGGR